MIHRVPVKPCVGDADAMEWREREKHLCLQNIVAIVAQKMVRQHRSEQNGKVILIGGNTPQVYVLT